MKGSKAFFSEEKKQKTFISPSLPSRRPWPGSIRGRQNESFFGSFFSKKEHS
jgi:hypothetical protein